MAQIPLGIGAYSRPFGKLPEIRMENRFFEQNPVGAEKVSLLSRPGSKLFLQIGVGPIRMLFSQAGVFNEDLFIVSGEALYRYNGVATTLIAGAVTGAIFPVMTSISIPGWEAVFITNGSTMQYYEGEGHATGMLTRSGPIAADETVRIDNTYYKWTAGDVNGVGDGTVGTPWLVKLAATHPESLSNLFDAIGLGGLAGTTYGSTVTAHPSVRAYELTETAFKVRALTAGVGGNALVTTETGINLVWGAATLTGGGGHALKPVSVPDNVPIVDLATLASHIICVQGNSHKFFWIRPGEVNIEPLDYSSAESEPDHIVNVVVMGDQFWLLGQSSTEVWYASGDADQPFLRSQGRAFSQGVISGTVAKVQDTLVVVAQDRVAYKIAGAPERISHYGIEEKIRLWQESL